MMMENSPMNMEMQQLSLLHPRAYNRQQAELLSPQRNHKSNCRRKTNQPLSKYQRDSPTQKAITISCSKEAYSLSNLEVTGDREFFSIFHPQLVLQMPQASVSESPRTHTTCRGYSSEVRCLRSILLVTTNFPPIFPQGLHLPHTTHGLSPLCPLDQHQACLASNQQILIN